MTVSITRMELDAAALRAAATRSNDAAAARRMLALALVMEGYSRSEAARAAGMDRQTLHDWVHRYNESGLAGLHNVPEHGRPPRKLTAEQEATVAEWIGRGPPADHTIVRWRCVDLRDEIARAFGVQLHERSVR
jgi:transposase